MDSDSVSDPHQSFWPDMNPHPLPKYATKAKLVAGSATKAKLGPLSTTIWIPPKDS